VDRRVWMLAVERTSDVHVRDTLHFFFNSLFLGSRKFARFGTFFGLTERGNILLEHGWEE
jgi:hypothetical protein